MEIPAIEKLLDIVASGIGSVAGPMLAPWRASKEAEAKKIMAMGNADILQIQANAQSEARKLLISSDSFVTGELEIADSVNQRIAFQEQKRHANIHSVVEQAARQLGNKRVPDSDLDHDWTARFFNEVQDVSSEEMRSLWARVLAGEIERSGSTSVRTLSVLKDLDQKMAHLFRKLCSTCVFLTPDENVFLDARVPSLGGHAAQNSLIQYGLNFGQLNRLNEHGLIISDYNSNYDYDIAIVGAHEKLAYLPFTFQGQRWVLLPNNQGGKKKTLKLSGVALTMSGIELLRIVELEPMEQFAQDLNDYFLRQNLKMIKLNESEIARDNKTSNNDSTITITF